MPGHFRLVSIFEAIPNVRKLIKKLQSETYILIETGKSKRTGATGLLRRDKEAHGSFDHSKKVRSEEI